MPDATGKLVFYQVIMPKVTKVQLAAIAASQGISHMRLGGELLAKAVEILYEETFSLQDEEAVPRISAFDSDPDLYKRGKEGG